MITDILQPTHLIFILVVALLVLGPKRLPEAGRAIGSGLRSFRGAMAGIESEAQNLFSDDSEKAAAPEPTIVEPEIVSSSSVSVSHAAVEEVPQPVAVAPATVIAPAAPTVVSSTSRADENE